MRKSVLTVTLLGLAAATPFSANSMGLGEAVQTALKGNPEIGVARQQRESIRHEVREAQGRYLPSLDLELGAGWERSNNSSTRSRASRPGFFGTPNRSLFRKESRLSATQMIYDGWATPNRVAQQKARLTSAEEHIDETEEIIALSAIEAYLEVLRTQELVRLSDAQLKLHGNYVRQISARAEGGVGNEADVKQAQGRYALAQSNLLSFQRDEQDAKAFFLRVVGQFPGQLTKVQAPHSSVPQTFESALQRAIGNSPAIKSAKSNIEAAREAHSESKSAFRPRFDVELSATRNHNLDGVQGVNHDALAMLRMRQNLYRGGQDSARTRRQAERIVEAEAELEKSKREVEENMRTSWHALQSARLRLMPLSQHVKSSEDTRNAYSEQFDLGQRSLLDLLDAEIELFNARVSLINEHFTHDFAAYGILANAGDLSKRYVASSE